ncbi:MAG: DUF4388 domain-containing protein [Acidimicrobiales bacterium]
MALSGTLDTFALPDVLRLLATTGKTGRLRVTGDRGSGSVWVEDGAVVATELTTTTDLRPGAADVVFGLLRFSAGSFTFEADARAVNAGAPIELEAVLSTAENMLTEWRAIEEVVPSLDVYAVLRPELANGDVMIDSDRWRCVAAIGSGVTAATLARLLELSEMDACRLLKELIELGLVELSDPPVDQSLSVAMAGAGSITADHDRDHGEEGDLEVGTRDMVNGPSTVSDPEPDGDPDAGDFDPIAEVENGSGAMLDGIGSTMSFDSTASPGLAGLEPSGGVDPLLPATDPLASGGNGSRPTDTPSADPGELDPAEMARQLANLSPKAAKAVAAAAKASTAAERDAALAEVEAEDETVNRGLLLKFLGSVDT